MKKIIFTLALLVQVAFAMATDNKKTIAQPRQENIKMYLQPSTSMPIVKSLGTADRVEVVRRYNALWTIVVIDGQAGYVLHSEIAKPTNYQNLVVARAQR